MREATRVHFAPGNTPMRPILIELFVGLMLVLATPTAHAAKPEIIELTEDVETRGMTCSPQPTEVETRRPIPMLCKVDYPTAGVELRYRSTTGTKKWSRIGCSKPTRATRHDPLRRDRSARGARSLRVRAQREEQGDRASGSLQRAAPSETRRSQQHQAALASR